LEKEESRAETQRRWMKGLGLFSIIVADVVGYSGAGVAVGYLAMTKLGAPWWVLVLTTLAGLSLGMYRLYQLSQRIS
jgi:F0F1-type ATP synthase assembly protein I